MRSHSPLRCHNTSVVANCTKCCKNSTHRFDDTPFHTHSLKMHTNSWNISAHTTWIIHRWRSEHHNMYMHACHISFINNSVIRAQNAFVYSGSESAHYQQKKRNVQRSVQFWVGTYLLAECQFARRKSLCTVRCLLFASGLHRAVIKRWCLLQYWSLWLRVWMSWMEFNIFTQALNISVSDSYLLVKTHIPEPVLIYVISCRKTSHNGDVEHVPCRKYLFRLFPIYLKKNFCLL